MAANDAYLEKAFGINKQKTETSFYSDRNRPSDSEIFGAYTGDPTDFIGTYAQNTALTSHFAPAISYDTDSNTGTRSSVKISDYQHTDPTSTPSGYIVRLTGNTEHDPNQLPGSKLAAPEGYIAYQDAGGATQTIQGSAITQLTQAEFDTLEYVMDLANRDDETDSGQRLSRQDYLSVAAVAPDPADGTEMQRGYISKISLSRGDFSAMPSDSGDQIYHAKMTIPQEQFFNAFTLKAEGTYISDGNASTNAADGTLLDMVNEGRVEIFAREIGYDTRLMIDTAKSSNDTLVFTKDSTKLCLLYTSPSPRD